jgi:hypothetical protein
MWNPERGGRLQRIGRELAARINGQGVSVRGKPREFLIALSDEDYARVTINTPGDRRANRLRAQFERLWEAAGRDPAERRRRAEVEARLAPILADLSEDEWQEVRADPSSLAKYSERVGTGPLRPE